ncbi:MAG: LCP family protein [Clostridiales bacterium]|nr:LCP family protein [Clostridiales bacterium]
MSKEKKKKKKKKFKFILVACEVLVLVVLIVVAYMFVMLNKIDYVSMDNTEAGINEDLAEETIETLEGYTNIAIFGVDNRSANNYDTGNSDVIMIASIDNKTKDVKLVSVYRDTFLCIGDGKYRKANAAYANGGAKQAVQMLNSNLDLNITEYICVDWAAMVEVIDDLGGLEIEITQAEMNQINKYKKDVDGVTGLSTPDLTEYGLITLDGTQATTYARIRKLAGDDFKRASRQRIVLQAMLEKAKSSSVTTLVGICNDIVDDISTTLTTEQIISLAKDVKSYNIVSTTGFPFDLTTEMIGSADCVIPADLSSNVTQLHEYMFGVTDYTPTQTVQTISTTVVEKTGITAYSAVIDTSEYNETAGADGTDELSSD